jgi:AcrR family transcriptional regulator
MSPEKDFSPSHETRSTDRRTNRTRRQLRDALMTLILEKGYDAVTVEDITSRADLGRTTFYLHYRDKEELLLESIDSIANDLKSQVDLKYTAPAENNPQKRPIHLAFAHAAENAALYRILLNGEGATKTASHLRRFISDNVAEFLLAGINVSNGNLTDQPLTLDQARNSSHLGLVADYFASALLGFMTWWLEADMPYPPDQMADFFLQTFFEGARGVLGLPAIRPAPPGSLAASESSPLAGEA